MPTPNCQLFVNRAPGNPGANDPLWPSRLLGELANFIVTRIIRWTLVVIARVAVETLERAVFCNANVVAGGNSVPLVV